MNTYDSDHVYYYEDGEFSDDPDSWLPWSDRRWDMTAEEDRVSVSSAEDDSPYSVVFYAGPFEDRLGEFDLTVHDVSMADGTVTLVPKRPLRVCARVRRVALKAFWSLRHFSLSLDDLRRCGPRYRGHEGGVTLEMNVTWGQNQSVPVLHSLRVTAEAKLIDYPLDDAEPYRRSYGAGSI